MVERPTSKELEAIRREWREWARTAKGGSPLDVRYHIPRLLIEIEAQAKEIEALTARQGLCLDESRDATDAACPAWWRGQEAGAYGLARKLQAVLDGKDKGWGQLSSPMLQKLRDDLLQLTAERDRLREALRPFADEAEYYKPEASDARPARYLGDLLIGDLRCARSTINTTGEDKG